MDTVDNATRSEMTRAIDHLMARVHPEAIVLVYFGGYGVQSGGQNYLIPIDAKIWNEADVRQEGVSIRLRPFAFKTSGARIRLVVIDASRRNPYERRFRACSHGLAPIQTRENTLILSSAAPVRIVDDSREPHSQLMSALLVLRLTSRQPVGILPVETSPWDWSLREKKMNDVLTVHEDVEACLAARITSTKITSDVHATGTLSICGRENVKQAGCAGQRPCRGGVWHQRRPSRPWPSVLG